ncbi:hypothetical protein [Clostridium sp.]
MNRTKRSYCKSKPSRLIFDFKAVRASRKVIFETRDVVTEVSNCG